MTAILIIDDNTNTRSAIRRALEEGGYSVIESPNGKDGERLYKKMRPDIIITAIFMPEQDGLETIMHIRRNDKNIPIIALSDDMEGRCDDFLSIAILLGASATINFPMSAQYVNATVQNILGGRRY